MKYVFIFVLILLIEACSLPNDNILNAVKKRGAGYSEIDVNRGRIDPPPPVELPPGACTNPPPMVVNFTVTHPLPQTDPELFNFIL
jgi:hypothetical protein